MAVTWSSRAWNKGERFVSACRSILPKTLATAIIRKQLGYWTFLLGPRFSKHERSQMNLSRFYSMAQIEYCRNFIFKRYVPIHKIFERSCELGWWRLTAHRISEIFGTRLNKRLRGEIATVIEQIEDGHHVFRTYWKNASSSSMKNSPAPPQ